MGHAHSIETWAVDAQGERALVGGLYGVGFARVFCGESMFSRQSDASKVALAWLVAALRRAGAMLLDCQFSTPHLASLGAIEIPQAEYLALLDEAGRYSVVESPGVPPSSTTGASSAGAYRPAPRPEQRACRPALPRSWPQRPRRGCLPRRGISSRSP
jgi:leucyl/phenylalanyl-tRNA--protein transferase